MKLALIVCSLTLASTGSASACTYPPPPTFEGVGPTSKHIFVFQVLKLEYRQSREGDRRSEWVEGEIRVVETFRGTPKFARVRFNNDWCGGLRLDVGHSYLVATNAANDTLQFALGDKSVLDISLEYNPSWKSPVETSGALRRLLRALEGQASFRDVPRPAYYLLTSPLPAPP